MPIIAVFGSSHCMPDSFEYNIALDLGKILAENGYDLATGGYSGTMEAVLKAGTNFNVSRIGVTTKEYSEIKPNEFIQIEYSTETYLSRLSKIVEVADAFVVLNGDLGTLLEFTAVWTLKSKRLIDNKPLIVVGEVWTEILQILGFYSEVILENMDLILRAEDNASVLSILKKEFNK
jgi:uncharacterized protein (TIGR00725 family)